MLAQTLIFIVSAVGDFIPARRIVPGLWGLDLATLLLALLTEALKLWLMLEIKGAQSGGAAVGAILAALFALAAIHIAQLVVYLVMGALILQAILSWVNPYSPIAPILNSVTRPFLRPFQRVIPLIAICRRWPHYWFAS